MSSITRRAAAVLLLLLCAGFAGSMDLTEGRLRLTLHEGIGRFSLSYLSNSRESAYTPLLVAQDPRTTALSIVVGNKVSRLGEGSEFAQSVERTAEGARFIWKSSLLTVTESFSFVASEGSSSINGVRIDVEVKNTSRQTLMVGLRYLFDTYLGEASFLHFRTDAIPDVTRELTVSGDAMPKFWVSPLADDAEGLGLQVMTSAEGVTAPDKVVFANWKRLNDASWNYATSASRNFNLLPYSVNDSAVAQYYEPRSLEKGSGMSVTLCLGKYTPEGFALRKPVVEVAAATAPAPAEQPPVVEEPAAVEQPPVVEEPPAVDETPVVEQPPAVPEQPAVPAVAPEPPLARTQEQVRVNLSAVNALITEMDGKIASGGAITEDDLERLRAAIAELKARSSVDATGAGATTPGK